MKRLRISEPVWFEQSSANRGLAYSRLAHNVHVDVAVIGGGVTGAAVAWMFARSGVRVAVLEASRVGHGSTAASTALLMQEPDTDLVDLVRRFGETDARRIWRLTRDATKDFIGTLAALRIRCHLEHRDSVYYAPGTKAARRLHLEWRHRRRAGLAGRWMDPSALRRLTGIDGAGAIRTSGNAQVNPYLASTGLLRAARGRGARIFERSRVDRIDTDADGATLGVNGRAVRCKQVVIATGYATPDFKPLVGRFRLLHTYVVATGPLTAEARRDIGLGDVMLWDTGRPYHYARWTADNRLLLGGGDRPRVPERQRAKALREGAARVWRHFEIQYPALRRVDAGLAWEGLFATTPDGLPFIGVHPDYPKHLFALGYGGNGMTFGFLGARLLLDWYCGKPSDDHRLFGFARPTTR
jgi:glycine/D-amino acid oxidase-like deaminating enzyme